MTQVTRLAPEVVVEGRSLPQAWREALTQLRVELGLRAVGQVTIRYADPGYALSAQSVFAIGATVEVGVVGDGSLATAEVSGVAIEQRAGMPPELTVTAHDVAHRLTGATRVRTFTNATYADMIRSVLHRAGVSGRVADSSTRHEYVLQVGTDLDFVDELSDRLGWDWQVEGRQVVVGPPSTESSTTVELGSDISEFSVRASGRHPGAVEARGWSRSDKREVASKPAMVSEAAPAAASQLVDSFVASAGSLRTGTAITAATAVSDRAEADSVAGALRDRLAAAAVTARGRGPVNRALRPGAGLTVTHAGPASGTYFVSQVEHVYRRSGFETRFVAGERRPTGLVDTLSSAPAGGGLTHDGLVVGVVTNNDDPEKLGRVKVNFPWISVEVESAWARVASIGGGGNRGMVSLPEVNDEVLVGFEGGDLRTPVVLGGLHGGKDRPPEYAVKSGRTTYRRITSRLGHVIEMADGDPPDRHILIALAGGDRQISLAHDRMDIELPGGVPFTLKAGEASIAVDAGGGIVLDGTKVEITGRQGVSINGMNVALKADAEVSMEAAVAAIRAKVQATVEGAAALNLKAGVVKIN
ncbi:hypothetical protein G1H11_00175 [Phytoactinopolyspora alkaliphila]|uniref:Gp5/Type VI secretion system Vgr protein OB-fold domain-containing protein n=1 Tax=Phytoactinopolyspora alkaliphila TaxID=1783498 RepID=A0A6N9YFP8_9ACTN|nr:phage baseplate assembly protein V [Phytoactinopolyspora alkaliphila]NED93728.1 hypothetical protein [Phytoactinopolyspora alkaliphila]